MVGGAPLNEEFGRAIGADAYCRDAAVAVETAKDFMARKHNQLRRLGVGATAVGLRYVSAFRPGRTFGGLNCDTAARR